MPDFTITVDTNDAKIVQRIATLTGKTGRELIELYISNWANGQIEGYFIDKIKSMTTAELISLLGDIE